MVHRDRSNVNKLCQIVLVGHIVAMPSDDIKRAVVLRALKELSAHLVDDFPRIIVRYLIMSLRVQEVASISKSIRSQGP